MYMVFFVLNDNSFLDQILKAWYCLGFSGATIIETTGQYRRHHHKRIPMRFTYGESPIDEIGNTTLFLIVENEEQARSCLEAIEETVGNLDNPNTGVFSAWPLSITKGVPTPGKNKEG
jgi:hypothetical protein